MAQSMADQPDARHRELAESRPRMAKAALRKADTSEWREKVGRAIQRAASLVGWSLKELAGAIERDPRQVARWLAGTERPQFDALFAVDVLRWPLV